MISLRPLSERLLQLYLSGRRGSPFLTALAQGVRDGDELSGDGGDDDLVRFSGLAEAICEGLQVFVVMCRDQCRLEHHMPQGTATSSDGPFSAKGPAVVRDRGQSSECSSLFAGGGADLGHFGDQHCAGNRTDPRDETKNTRDLRQAIIARDGPGDPVFQFLDQAVDPLLQFAVDILEHRGGAQFPMCADLGQQPFAHLDQLRSFGRQGSEKAQLFCGKTTACFGPECEEASDEFGSDPIGPGACATDLRKRLHLSGGHLAGCNAFRLQKRPQLSFLTASRFKADDSISVPGKSRHSSMTCRGVWHSAAVPIGEAMNVKPIAADIYADNAAM